MPSEATDLRVITLEGRVSHQEAKVAVFESVVTRIENYMQKGMELRVAAAQTLGRIETLAEQNKAYQDTCTADRTALGNHIVDLEKFRTEIETSMHVRISTSKRNDRIFTLLFNIATLILAGLEVHYGR